ncbi:MAG: hypothetical protein D6695_03885 [Planctomycetota bacterium]|nr:MAG: hypothetical protein D6695_03885 [Planctomycetota bacterium]
MLDLLCASLLLIGLAHIDSPAPIRTEIVVEAPVSEVWAAWTSEPGLESWLAPSALVELRPGGRYAINVNNRIGESGTVELRVLAFEPNRMFAYTTTPPDDEFLKSISDGDSWAVVTFTPLDASNTLVQHTSLGWRGGDDWDDTERFVRRANQYVLEMLRRRFEGQHTPLIVRTRRIRALSRQIDVAAPADVAWDVLTTPRGLASWLGDEPKVDLSFGGSIAYSSGAGSEPIIERILAFDPGRVLATQYDLPKSLEGPLGVVEHTWTVTRLEPLKSGGTRITRTMLGWESGRQWENAYRFFESQMEQQMSAFGRILGSRKDPDEPTPAEGDQAVLTGRSVLERLGSLAGTWIGTIDQPGQATISIRNTFELGPDGLSVVSSSSVDSGDGYRLHASGLSWLDAGTDQARFLSIDEAGDLSQGTITLQGDELVWDWHTETAAGERRYEVRIVILSTHRYRMTLEELDGKNDLILDAEFERIEDTKD